MILIRADANEIIGMGHLMRCLSIAHAFDVQGETVLFITADHSGDDLIRQAGFKSICLETERVEMDDELSKINTIIQEYRPSLFLLDSYNITEEYCKTISRLVKTAYMDDLNISVWDVNYIINYNVFSLVMDYSLYEQTDTIVLLGPNYAPLRDEFKNLPKHTIRNEVTDILISVGGTDPEAVTEKMILGTCPKWKNIQFHCIVGPLNPRLEQIKQLEEKIDNVDRKSVV